MVYFALILIFNFAASEKCSKVVILPSKYYNSEGVFDANKDVDQTSDDKQDETPKFSPCQKCCCNAETNQIDCTYSNLETIPENAHYMTHIYLDYNHISNIKVPETNDIDTKTIELWLRNNKLRSVDFGELEKFTELRLLTLQGNLINSTTLPSQNLTIEVLELPGNFFSEIFNNTFDFLPHLKNLSLSTNRIENIQQDAFIKLTSLQELILRSNYLKHFSFGTGFGAIPELVKLDISNNLIQIIDKALFTGLEKLEILKLNGNKLTYIQPIAFNRLKNLKYLDLTENWFTTINPAIFDPIMVSLAMIDVTTNPIICDCGINSFLNWARLNSKQLINGDKIQCMYGGEEEATRKLFSRTLYSLSGTPLCSTFSDLKIAILIPCIIFGMLLLVVCITCIKRKIFSETKEIEEYEANEQRRQAVEDIGSIGSDEMAGIPVSLMPQQIPQVNPELMANRPEVMGAVRQQQLEHMGMDPLHARIAVTRGARDMSATGYSSSAYGSDDDKPRRVQRPDLNARQQQSDSEEDENHQNFRGHGF